MKAVCPVCPHACALELGQVGLCGARSNADGSVGSISYGMVTALTLDPIEKKPLRMFHPGSQILSVGSFGCNLRCPFCQNHSISMDSGMAAGARYISPEELLAQARELKRKRNIGIAYTYNEPLVGYEYVYDCALLVENDDMKNVVVTNGYINQQPLKKLLPHIHAMNIDLKAFNERFYHMAGGGLQTVRDTITTAVRYCHVEVTTLIIPGKNDSEEEMEALASWLASVDRGIPYHISRFFPTHRMADGQPTSVEKMEKLADIARAHLHHVFLGNV